MGRKTRHSPEPVASVMKLQEGGLKWQRLGPYRKFARMIEAHWDGIASYCHPENKVSPISLQG